MSLLFLIYVFCAVQLGHAQEDRIPPHQMIELMRMQRDAEMLTGNELPDADKKTFKGLHYFPINLKYRVTVRLQKPEKIEYLDMTASDGRQRQARRYGFFDFLVDGGKYRLNVYKLTDVSKKYPHLLFVPFMDATSNRESYGGGRYLDLTEQEKDEYIVDFNLAYNPSCAYGKTGFSCPIPPLENHLKVRIEAGEKKWKH
jgi:hypothetical protein